MPMVKAVSHFIFYNSVLIVGWKASRLCSLGIFLSHWIIIFTCDFNHFILHPSWKMLSRRSVGRWACLQLRCKIFAAVFLPALKLHFSAMNKEKATYS